MDPISVEPRLHAPPRSALADEVVEILRISSANTGGAAQLFELLAHNPGLLRAFVPFGGRLLVKSGLDPMDREAVILRAAWLCRCGYELHHHRRIAAEAGLGDSEVDAITSSNAHSLLGFRAVLVRATDELVQQHAIMSDTWQELARVLSPAQLIEVPMLVGNYVMLAGLINSVGVQVEL